MHRWKDTEEKEMWVFLGLILQMPLAKKHRIVDYWNNKDSMTYVTVFGKYMKMNKYLLL